MIVFGDGTTLVTGAIISSRQQVRGQSRQSLKINIPGDAEVTYADGTTAVVSYDFLKEYLADGVSITVREIVPMRNEETGEDGQQINDYPYPDHVLAGPITDNADGTWTALVCAKTHDEIVEEENADLLLMLVGGDE